MLAILKFSFKPNFCPRFCVPLKGTTLCARLCNVPSKSSVNSLQSRHIFSFLVKPYVSFSNCSFRCYSSNPFDPKKRRTTLNYVIAGGLFCLCMSFAAVPLYRMFCEATSYGGTVTVSLGNEKVAQMKPDKDKPIKILFNADVSSSLRWNFKPVQREIIVRPGETALAFYTATNPTDVPITGVSSYNVLPFEAGQYFVKIQCFCFEEQQLNPHEQVDMPVFFYIDPEFSKDPKMEFTDELVLSYTFFEAKEASNLLKMIPSYAKQHILPQEPQLSVS